MNDRGVSWRTLARILGLHGLATLVAGARAFLATVALPAGAISLPLSTARAAAAALPGGFRSHRCGKEL